ncbi:unnamed protein product [Candida parapsilosis]
MELAEKEEGISICLVSDDAVVGTTMKIVATLKFSDGYIKIVEVSYVNHEYSNSNTHGLFAALGVLKQAISLSNKLQLLIKEDVCQKYANRECNQVAN